METTMRPPIRLHRFALSGHAHRVQLMLSLLDLPCTLVEVDLPGRAHKSPAFLALNAFGQVPVIEDGEHTLADSNAILVYLATRYDPARRWLPADAAAQAAVQRWLSVAAGPLAAGPAAARVETVFGRPHDPQTHAIARRLFDRMEQHLAARDWLAAPHPTIADVALYSYTAHAPEGGIDLAPWPQVQAWLHRVEALPGFVPMVASRIPEPA
jgi:glutathione S-transferase